MITAQDIREKTFEKSRIGGYDMASVDNFLEEIADDITAAQKENSVLKSKMKVLVDKIEEYRANEEALNLAVISAQKLAVQIEADARTRAAAMIADADKQVKLAVGSIQEQTAAEEKRLETAKAATAKFIEAARAICNTQLKNIDSVASGILPQAADMTPADIAVVELSSFQLMTMERSADIAVVTNVAPNHLDVHKDMAEYVQAKKNVFEHQNEAGKVVLNYDNDITRGFAADAKGTVEFFSRLARPENGVYLEDGVICRNGKKIMAAADIRIPGVHNIENYMAAACAVEGLAEDEDIDAVARTFAGVEHRIEFVRELDGVKYYNDSIASSPSRTIAGLHSFRQKLVLIAGGYDKKIPFDALGPEICAHVRLLILCGATAEKIEAAVKSAPDYRPGQPEILHAQTLEEAVRLAKRHTVPGDIVTLSPACAAFDQFKNFMVRGETYKTLVRAL